MIDPIRDGMFVVGDAAGQCLPVSGEGIRPALVFGQLAGRLAERVRVGELTLDQALSRYRAYVLSRRHGYRFLDRLQSVLNWLPDPLFALFARTIAQPRVLPWAVAATGRSPTRTCSTPAPRRADPDPRRRRCRAPADPRRRSLPRPWPRRPCWRGAGPATRRRRCPPPSADAIETAFATVRPSVSAVQGDGVLQRHAAGHARRRAGRTRLLVRRRPGGARTAVLRERMDAPGWAGSIRAGGGRPRRRVIDTCVGRCPRGRRRAGPRLAPSAIWAALAELRRRGADAAPASARDGPRSRGSGRRDAVAILARVLGAILTAMVTPFDPDLRVDEAAAVALAHHLVEHGSDGLVMAGTTGEASTLTDDEKVALYRLAVREVGRRARASWPAPAATTRPTRCTSRASRPRSAWTPCLVVTPYYNRPPRAGIIGHVARHRRGRRAGDPLQHPRPLGRQHAARPDRRAGRDPERGGRQAGQPGPRRVPRGRADRPASRSTRATTTCCFPVARDGRRRASSRSPRTWWARRWRRSSPRRPRATSTRRAAATPALADLYAGPLRHHQPHSHQGGARDDRPDPLGAAAPAPGRGDARAARHPAHACSSARASCRGPSARDLATTEEATWRPAPACG